MQHYGLTPARTRCRFAIRTPLASLALASLALAKLAAMTTSPAAAAKRPCFPVVLVFAASPTSELEARKQVLAAWSTEARKHGEAFSSWRLAWQKSIECGRRPDGVYNCRAAGKPCAIVQVPGTLPPGTKPVARPRPGNA